MSVSFNRRSKVLLALVASMTFGSSLLFWLAPEPMAGVGPGLVGVMGEAVPVGGVQPSQLANWKRIVIHESRQIGSLEQMEQAHQASYGGCAYHFVVTPEGRVQASARWKNQQLAPQSADGSAVAGVQIVLIGRFDSQPPSAAQMTALRQLVDQLTGGLNIPRQAVLLHSQVQPVACPGPAFPQSWLDEPAI